VWNTLYFSSNNVKCYFNFQNEKCHSPKSRRSQDKDNTVPRKIVPKIAPDTEIVFPENIDALPESSSISGQTCSTSSGSWWSSPLSRLAGSGSSSQSVLSFDRLIPRSGESVNRKRPGKGTIINEVTHLGGGVDRFLTVWSKG
jgi:hypothetical protein